MIQLVLPMKMMDVLKKICVLGLALIWTYSARSQFTQFKYENGIVSSEGTMKDGKPDGYWKTYYPDGGMKTEGNRLNFKLDSTWNFYREDSTLERSITYSEDIKNGPERLYGKRNNVLEEYQNKNGIRDGAAKYFYETGELRKTLTFINNKEEGKSLEYDKDGRIITLITYRNGFIYAEEKINRVDANGKRTGIWRDLYQNGQVQEDGNWSNGLRNGVFKFYSRKGELEKLEKYEDGILVIDEASTGILDVRQEYFDNGKVRTSGPFREGKRQGNFREYDITGKEMGGTLYDNDVMIGQGMIDSLGRRTGKWKLFYPDGTLRSEGEYVHGKKEGPWNYFYSNGQKEQKGAYKDDLPTGQWQWFFPDGKMHREEMYRRGKEDGHAVEYDEAGNVINEGDYSDGAKSGPWILTINDHHEEGSYADGERDGLWIWTYANGNKAFQGEFQVGVPIGRHKYWLEDGKESMTGEYEGGEMNGRWDYFDENGLLILQMEYEAGQVVRINGKKIKLPEPKDTDN
jgi:antitoxin component YwqK of YwqJK toxin-antitoxin module